LIFSVINERKQKYASLEKSGSAITFVANAGEWYARVGNTFALRFKSLTGDGNVEPSAVNPYEQRLPLMVFITVIVGITSGFTGMVLGLLLRFVQDIGHNYSLLKIRADKAQDGLGGVKDLRSRVAANWKGLLVDHLLPAQLYSGDSEGAMAHDPMRTRIFEHPVDLFGRQVVFSGTAITPSMHAYMSSM
jgi:hypothetical protein